jgi:uncharacterized protein (DUF58 family)
MQNFLAFVIGLFIIAAVFRIDFFFYLLYMFFGIYFLSQWWTARGLRGIACAREYTNRAFLGERVNVKLHVRNQGFLPMPWLRIHDSMSIQLKTPNFFRCVLSLFSRESATLSYDLECRRRGYYTIGPLLVGSGDLFGLHTIEKRLTETDHLLVYPHIIPLTQLGLPAQTPFGVIPSKQHLFEDPTRIVGVRAYQSGDSMRHIDWKTTATTGVLQVKRFEPAISIEAQVFLNLNRSEYTLTRVDPASELAIVTAASVANYLIAKRQTVGLTCNGVDPTADDAPAIILPPRKGNEQLMAILDCLARVQVSEQRPFVDLLRAASLHLTWGGTAIIITPDADEALFENMLFMKRSGFHVVLIVLDPKTPFVVIQYRAQEVGIRAYQVWQESDLDVWRAKRTTR